MSLKNCIESLSGALSDFDTDEVVQNAAEYRARGMTPKEAEIKAVEDHIAQLESEQERIAGEVVAAHEKQAPASKPTKPTVSGNSVVTDAEAARTKQDSLAQSVTKETAPQALDAPSPNKTADKIEDFGEKIGGARKDDAVSTGPRGTKAKEDERPTWRKRYTVSQISKSTKPEEEGRYAAYDERTKDRLGQHKPITRKTFTTEKEAEDAVTLFEVARNHRVVQESSDGEPKYKIVRDVTDRKRVTIKDGFKSQIEAMKYMAAHAVEIIETKTGFGEEILVKPEKAMRAGPERRTGPATAKMFADTFGFRAVEFGNWETQDERQDVMNHAYDGLLDLAELIGVPPKAVSLNGDLALAFGARGHGLSGARAHYERDRAVINLTKMQGAGALGHEWMHAVDHYFGRQDIPSRATKKKNEDGTFVFATSGREDYLSHGTAIRDSGMRKELRDAYTKMVKDLYSKAEKYVEDTEKVEKFLSRQRDEVDRTLKDMRSYLERSRDWKKRNNKPATVEQLAEWDALAEKILDGGDLAVTYKNSDKKHGSGRYTNDTVEALSAIYKAVTGSAGFTSERSGSMDGLVQTMKHYKERIDQVESAAKSEEKTRRVPTSYAMEAKKIDQGRASDYWSTEHEMLARAFSAYVEDKLKADKKSSEFLSFGSDNKYYTLLGIRPFPVGEERAAMGKSFDEFFRVVETRETDKGVGMFAKRDNHRWAEVANTAAGPMYSNDDVTLFPGGVAGAGLWENEAVYSVLDNETGQSIGEVVVGITDGQIDTLYWIQSHSKGMGTRTMRAIVANSTAPVTIDNIMDTAKPFWDKLGIYDYDGRNAKLDWRSFKGKSAQGVPGSLREGAGVANPARSGSDAPKGLTTQAVQAYLEQRAGRGTVKGLIDSGLLKVLESTDTNLPARLRRAIDDGDLVFGFTDTDGTTYLIADNLNNAGATTASSEDAYAAFLHEVGVHHGMRAMLGDESFNTLVKWVAGADPDGKLGRAIAAARESVSPDTKPEHINEEVLAWLVTDRANHELPLVQRVVAKMQAFLVRLGFNWAATPDALVELARGAVRHASGTTDGDGRFARRAPWQKPKAPLTDEQKKNQVVRDQDTAFATRARKYLRRQLAPGGLLPDEVFREKIARDSRMEVVEFDVRNLIGQLEQSIKSAYEKRAGELDVSTNEKLALILAGGTDPSVPEAVRLRIEGMRTYLDDLSRHYLAAMHDDIVEMQAQLAAAGRAEDSDAVRAKIDLFETISGNVGRYVHRSYRAFDDPKWPSRVPDDVLSSARRYLSAQYVDKGESQTKAQRLAEVTINEILKTGTAYDSMESFIKESKLGAKDLSVLKKRQDIAPEIRALLGEYTDPRLNFAKSATKMSRLIFNHRFLKAVRRIGLGQFLFEGKDRPPHATKQFAAEGSESYAPLNGLWTFPEIEQAFREALGKEQMADWYRILVQINGFVKFGKTVLSPTTAMRNWQSAALFSVANGHFDIREARKSLGIVKEYFTKTGEHAKTEYIRKLKKLGVVYDTPYAGEMMRLLDDSRMANSLLHGKAELTVKQGLGYAQDFYRFGDDFWKILGYENEKRMLMRHGGMTEAKAEVEAAERIRNTYPTYSMVGKFVNSLRRFPLVGTFVSFPAEIIRTSYHIVRYAAQDWKTPGMRPAAVRRMAGIAIAAGFAHAIQALTMAALGIGDDEDEAVRDLAPPWQKNSNLAYVGRDEKGQLRYFDLSFLDPYNYWKRPLTAITRDEPWQDKFWEVARETLTPFFGVDIVAGTLFEVAANKKRGTGAPVFNENADPTDQVQKIADHIWDGIKPGIVSNIERTADAFDGKLSRSGKASTIEDEGLAWVGWRSTTVNPKAAIYFKSWEFKEGKSDAKKLLNDVLRDPNETSDDDLRDAYEASERRREVVYSKMSRLMTAARAAGMEDRQIRSVLKGAKISALDITHLMRGTTPHFRVEHEALRNALKKADMLFDGEAKARIKSRYQRVREISHENH